MPETRNSISISVRHPDLNRAIDEDGHIIEGEVMLENIEEKLRTAVTKKFEDFDEEIHSRISIVISEIRYGYRVRTEGERIDKRTVEVRPDDSVSCVGARIQQAARPFLGQHPLPPPQHIPASHMQTTYLPVSGYCPNPSYVNPQAPFGPQQQPRLDPRFYPREHRR
jgi:hypothetical protein